MIPHDTTRSCSPVLLLPRAPACPTLLPAPAAGGFGIKRDEHCNGYIKTGTYIHLKCLVYSQNIWVYGQNVWVSGFDADQGPMHCGRPLMGRLCSAHHALYPPVMAGYNALWLHRRLLLPGGPFTGWTVFPIRVLSKIISQLGH